jgi:A/G-specific adenine glycosylase
MNRIKNPPAPEAPGRNNSVNSVNSVKVRRLVPLLLAWFSQNARDLPWRRTRDPYAIWVSEIMLQQTQVKTVLPYWQRWMRELPTIESLAKASPEKIHKLWEGLGYYTRVRNLQKAAQLVVAHHSGRFPETFDAVLALPGIGRYTAGAICSIAFNQPAPILDGNVIRVLTRVFGIAENPREKKTNAQLWQLAGTLVTIANRKSQITNSDCSHLNQSLMELGALVCTPRQPRCDLCPVASHCIARREDRIEQLPNLGPRTVATARRFAAFVIENQRRFLVRQRPAGVVNAHLWEFPNIEVNGADLRAAARDALGFRPRKLEPMCTVKHSITRYRITLEAFAVNETPRADSGAGGGHWLKLSELQKLSFPSAHKKILNFVAADARRL